MLNALSGAMKDETNVAYDPRNNNCMCINGQLMLLDLIEHLEVVPGLELIQSNTDGLIIWIPDTCLLYTSTRNLVRFKDDSDFEGEDVTPRVELIGDNSLTKTLYCRQLCGQWHKEKLEAFRDLLESTEDRLIVFYNFNEELTRLRKICESLNREVSFVNGSGRSRCV